MENEQPKCEHEWKTYRQTIQPQQRTEKQINQGMEFVGSRAYFVVKGCTKCKEKQYIDYRIEGIHE